MTFHQIRLFEINLRFRKKYYFYVIFFVIPGGQIRSKLLCILDLLRISDDDVLPDLPLLDFLDPAVVEQILAQCEETVNGRRQYDVRHLHSILFRELNSLQGPALASQRGQISEVSPSKSLYY